MALSLHELESQAADCLPARQVLTLIGGGRGTSLTQDPVPTVEAPQVPGEEAVDSLTPGDVTELLPTEKQDLNSYAEESLQTVTGSLPTDETAGDALDILDDLSTDSLLGN